jgi:DNA-binding NarL/FixJ family response regulator
MRIKLVIAEDHRIACEGLRSLFSKEPDMEILGYAEDTKGLIDLTMSLSPDVVLLGLTLPRDKAVEMTRLILQIKPSVRVIGQSQALDGQFARDFLSAGGAAFVTKCSGFAHFLDAIRAAMTRRIYLSPDVAERMVNQYVLRQTDTSPTHPALSRRQREVLQLVAQGMSTKEAAAALNISTKTVDMHRHHLMTKLQLHSIAELTKYAIREGITALHN